MRAGGCQCGALRFTSEGAPLALYACHCLECRKQSGSAFGLSLQVPRAGLRLVSGTPHRWTRATDSGGSLHCYFCAHCGSRLWHERAVAPETVTLKVGALDEAVDISHAIHIWVSRKLPGVIIPDGARQFPGEPDS